MIYLTYADPPSGVFSSQVNDVVNHLRRNLNADIRLVAFISIRDFGKNKSKIKNEVPDALVLPMLPKANYWRFSIVVLAIVCFFLGHRKVIARGVLACNVALGAKKIGAIKKLCYDGRGAIAAEWAEYKVAPYKNLINTIGDLERFAVMKTDFRISISEKLIHYWQQRFGYNSSPHVIIPCTLNSGFKPNLPSAQDIKKYREDLGFNADDMILVYSGSTAGWQSFSILHNFLDPFLKENSTHKILFMSGEDDNIKKMMNDYPDQVKCKWVDHKNVQQVLTACDYGILIREKSTTNKVASPTKFAEYLSAGLKVLISEEIGDYSAFVKTHNCGQVINEGEKIKTEKVELSEKQKMTGLVMKYFTKNSQNENYQKLIAYMNS